MMKTIPYLYKVYTTLLLVAVVTACTDTVDLAATRGEASGQVPLSVSAEVAPAASATRSFEPVESGSMGIFRLAQNDYAAQNNAQYTKANATAAWLPANNDQTVYVGGLYAKLCAYSPYNSVSFDATVPTKATLTAQGYKAAKDMSYANDGGAAIWKKTPQATFNLEHAYSRLTLAVTRDATEYIQACKISKVKLTPLAGKYLQTKTLDIRTTEAKDGTSASDFTWMSATEGWAVKDGIGSGLTDRSIDILLPPQALGTGDNLLTLTADGTDYSATLSALTLRAVIAGNRYVLSVLMKSKALYVVSVTLAEWTPVVVGGAGKDYDSNFD